jgi:hypothetical protein
MTLLRHWGGAGWRYSENLFSNMCFLRSITHWWKDQNKNRSPSYFAFATNLPAVRSHDCFGKRQAKAPRCAGLGRCPVETLEDVGHVIG